MSKQGLVLDRHLPRAESRHLLKKMNPEGETQQLVLLVDFGNTLVDETFMWQDTDRFASWTAHWSAVMEAIGSDWDHGRISSELVVSEMAIRLDCSPSVVNEQIDLLCRGISFYPKINTALARRRERGERQAIVTVNPDLFERLADLYALSEMFDHIVKSADLGTVEKGAICLAACRALGVQPPETLLIDNIEANVMAWRNQGGLGYVFEGDDRFALDVKNGVVPGFARDDCLEV